MKRLVLASILLVLLSCRQDDDAAIDFDVKRNNIVGDWEITQVIQEIRADTLYSEHSNTLSISFSQDGTGTEDLLIGTVDIEWLYQYNPEKVVITGAPSGPLILGSVQYYDIIKNEKNRQIWEFEVVPKNGVVDVYRNTWKMDRK